MPTREVKADYQQLSNYISTYSIGNLLQLPAYNTILKVCHRKLFGYLTFISEISASDTNENYSEESLKYFSECGSDLSQSLFCLMHGAYKPAAMSLRCSIETFLKALLGTDNPAIFSERSMYQLLDLARDSGRCDNLAREHYLKIKQSYADLCAITHTADTESITQVNALDLLPKFIEAEARKFMVYYVNVTERMIAVLLAGHRKLLSKMHHKNTLNILDALTVEIKKSILSFECD